MPINPKKNNKGNDFIKYSSIGIQMLVIIAFGTWGGIKLDELTDLSPLFTVLLSLASVGIAIYHAVKDFIKMN
ncbi:MAG: AtpZ/AtpI family protein [Bacteroidales bacterium]|nr:AtpZ/AtpI family protein [Bacteroidales bacterium]MCF8338409.1 AtpZ/AtpI family protein [Bacteroidales bacterium]